MFILSVCDGLQSSLFLIHILVIFFFFVSCFYFLFLFFFFFWFCYFFFLFFFFVFWVIFLLFCFLFFVPFVRLLFCLLFHLSALSRLQFSFSLVHLCLPFLILTFFVSVFHVAFGSVSPFTSLPCFHLQSSCSHFLSFFFNPIHPSSFSLFLYS